MKSLLAPVAIAGAACCCATAAIMGFSVVGVSEVAGGLSSFSSIARIASTALLLVGLVWMTRRSLSDDWIDENDSERSSCVVGCGCHRRRSPGIYMMICGGLFLALFWMI